ncbi:MAG: hypothetical protein AAGI07_16485 [Bacteroidota bacterium]
MKTLVKLIIFSASLFQIVFAQSQSPIVQEQNIQEIGQNWYNGSVITFDKRYKGVKGSPFLTEEWLPGTITLNNDTIIEDLHLKYNVQENRLYRRAENEKANLILNYLVKSFSIVGSGSMRNFIRVSLKDEKGEEINQFVELFAQGKLNLISKPECRIRKADSNNVYGSGRQYDEFIQNSSLYIYPKGERIAKQVKESKKFFIELMPDKENEIKAYFKENKPFLKDQQVVSKLVQYCNQL